MEVVDKTNLAELSLQALIGCREKIKGCLRLEPGQVIYADDPSKFIIPDGGDNAEEYW